ncbi:MAG: thioredoxin [Myxococcota bacterium]|jgi:thioredoxin 1|nr:thioredoxin [Myxococcota bacterium]MBP8971421.1 thioredoxin [Myxococcota bacterium]HHW96741.1 thioredoxin [Oligoflexales bacterium]
MKNKRPAYLSAKSLSSGQQKSLVKNVSDASFDAEVLGSDLPVLVDFWAPWCGPCKMVGPIVEELAKEYEGRLKVVKINTQDNPGVPGQMGVRSIPTLIIFKGSEVADHRVGAAPKESLRQMIEGVLNPKPSLFGRLFGGKQKAEEA